MTALHWNSVKSGLIPFRRNLATTSVFLLASSPIYANAGSITTMMSRPIFRRYIGRKTTIDEIPGDLELICATVVVVDQTQIVGAELVIALPYSIPKPRPHPLLSFSA